MKSKKYKYNNFVELLSKKFESLFLSIEATHGFDFGKEFEMVLCEALEDCLPAECGIARGFAVNEESEHVGDDIIIYQKSKFPTLSTRGDNKYARKEYIPVEAIYSYIEAKHTINLTGENGQSLFKACSQVEKVKSLCDKRPMTNPNKVSRYATFESVKKASLPEDFPDRINPAHGVIFARNVRDKVGGTILEDSKEILNFIREIEINNTLKPDLIVLGKNALMVPCIEKGGKNCIRAPFFIPGKSKYHFVEVKSTAFGVGIMWLLFALDWIELDVMPWHRIIVDALDIPFE